MNLNLVISVWYLHRQQNKEEKKTPLVQQLHNTNRSENKGKIETAAKGISELELIIEKGNKLTVIYTDKVVEHSMRCDSK